MSSRQDASRHDFLKATLKNGSENRGNATSIIKKMREIQKVGNDLTRKSHRMFFGITDQGELMTFNFFGLGQDRPAQDQLASVLEAAGQSGVSLKAVSFSDAGGSYEYFSNTLRSRRHQQSPRMNPVGFSIYLKSERDRKY